MVRFGIAAITLFAAAAASAWGPAAHWYLARKALPGAQPSALFGAMAADMNDCEWRNRAVAGAFKRLAHDHSEYLSPSAFRLGLLTHNAQWGADAYAHAYGHDDTSKPYPADRIRLLSKKMGLSMGDAEDVFEASMELAIRLSWGPSLGAEMQRCAESVGPREETWLVDAYAAPLMERVPGLSRASAEEAIRRMFRCYRILVRDYGALLSRGDPSLRLLAPRIYGMAFGFDRERANQCLACALSLCLDWRDQLDAIAAAMKPELERLRPAWPDLGGVRPMQVFFLLLRAVF